MKTIITERFASIGLLTLLSLVAVFHLLILVNVIPYDMVWGGRVTDITQMRRLELIALAMHCIMLTVVAIKTGRIRVRINPKLINGVLWLMFGLFLFNTVANLASLNAIERFVFTPLTLLLSVFTLRLASIRRKLRVS
jgi:hypothetical protein